MGSLEGFWVLRGHKRLAKGQPEHEREKVDIPFVVRRNKRLHEVSALSKDGTVVHQGKLISYFFQLRFSTIFHKTHESELSQNCEN